MRKSRVSGASGGRRRKRRASEPVVDSIIHEQADVHVEKKLCAEGVIGSQKNQIGISTSVLETQSQPIDPCKSVVTVPSITVTPSVNPVASANLSVNSFNNGSNTSSQRGFDLVNSVPHNLCGTTTEYDDTTPTATVVPPLMLSSTLFRDSGCSDHEIRGQRDQADPTTSSPTGITNRSEANSTQIPTKVCAFSESDRQAVAMLSQKMECIEKLLNGRLGEIIQEVVGMKKDVAGIKTSMSTVKDEVIELDPPVCNSRRQADPSKKIVGFSALFDKHVFLLVFERCILGMSMKIILSSTCGDNLLARVGLSIQSLMFSNLPGDPKAKYESKVGVQYCALRRALVRTCLGTVQQDVFSRFEEAASDRQDKLTWKGVAISKLGGKMKRPQWCNIDFIRTEHINEVQLRSETLQDSKTKVYDGTLNVERELALNVCSCLLTKVTISLTRARERCRRTFFEHIGFLFYKWSTDGADLHQAETEFIWNTDSEPPFTIESIAESSEMVIGKSIEDNVKAANMPIWNNLINRTPYFTLLVSYFVSVRPKASKSSTSASKNQYGNDDTQEAETKRMYRAFNLLDVAANFYCSYCNSKTDAQYDILYSSVHSFKVMFAFSLLLRKWMSDLINKFNEKGPQAFRDEYSSVKQGIYELYPSTSKMQAALMSHCLSLSAEEFADDCLDQKHLGRFKSFQDRCSGSSLYAPRDDDSDDGGASKDSDDAKYSLLDGSTGRFDDEDEDDFTQR